MLMRKEQGGVFFRGRRYLSEMKVKMLCVEKRMGWRRGEDGEMKEKKMYEMMMCLRMEQKRDE